MHQEEKIGGDVLQWIFCLNPWLSAAQDKSIGVTLTGMGQDGARG
jgi:hypothetical protein